MESEIVETRRLCEVNLNAVREALADNPLDSTLLQIEAELVEAVTAAVKAEAELQRQKDRTGSVIPSQKRALNTDPRILYTATEPNFAALARSHPELEPYLLPVPQGAAPCDQNATITRRSIDFTNPSACLELTKVSINETWGLDIGCGANLIYPLLGAATYGWHFVAVDVTPEAIRWAKRNRDANPQLSELIEVRQESMTPEQTAFFSATETSFEGGDEPPKSDGGDIPKPSERTSAGILTSCIRDGESFTFCMCNPPFFESLDEAGRNPKTAYGGTEVEMVYPGGEAAFVGQLFEDSLALKDRIHWYTTMVGKKATLKSLRKQMYQRGVQCLRTTEFVQGQTSRWGLAWSFTASPVNASQALPRSGLLMQKELEPGARSGAKVSSANIEVKTNTANAPTAILREVERCIRSRYQQAHCVTDSAQYCMKVELCGETAPSRTQIEEDRSRKRARHSDEVPWSFQVQVLMQNPKVFIMQLKLEKQAPAAAQLWFAGVVAGIRTSVTKALTGL